MNKKILTIGFIFLAVILLLVVGGFYFINNQQTGFEEESESFFDTIFPFGGTSDANDIPVIGEEVERISDTGAAPKLRHVSSFPIAGAFMFTDNEDNEIIRYVEKGTGHIYETATEELGQEKISNTTIPGIYEAVWINEDSVILRYFNESGDLESFYAELEDGSLDGSFLGKNIKDIKVVGGTIRYLLDTGSGSSLIKSNPDGSNRINLYNSKFSEWNIYWWNSTLAIISTLPTALSSGDGFFLNTNTGNLTSIFKKIPGLEILPNTEGDNILYSSNQDGNFILNVFDTEKEEFNNAIIQTLPEKCVWAGKEKLYCAVPFEIENGLYPDDWYKGVVSFLDDIWSVDLDQRSAEVIEYLDDETDGINLILSPSKDYLLFTNKKDSTLWSLRLED